MSMETVSVHTVMKGIPLVFVKKLAIVQLTAHKISIVDVVSATLGSSRKMESVFHNKSVDKTVMRKMDFASVTMALF